MAKKDKKTPEKKDESSSPVSGLHKGVLLALILVPLLLIILGYVFSDGPSTPPPPPGTAGAGSPTPAPAATPRSKGGLVFAPNILSGNFARVVAEKKKTPDGVNITRALSTTKWCPVISLKTGQRIVATYTGPVAVRCDGTVYEHDGIRDKYVVLDQATYRPKLDVSGQPTQVDPPGDAIDVEYMSLDRDKKMTAVLVTD